MENLRLWASGLCKAALIGTVAIGLTPSGSFEKCIKTVVSLFLLCAVILPIFNENTASENDYSKIFDISDTESEALADEACTQTSEYLKKSIEDVLQKNGINYREVVIEMKRDGSTLNVESVTVVNPSEGAEQVKAAVRNELGVEVLTEYEDD